MFYKTQHLSSIYIECEFLKKMFLNYTRSKLIEFMHQWTQKFACQQTYLSTYTKMCKYYNYEQVLFYALHIN